MAGSEGESARLDAQQIARIASESYGSLAKMFEKHHWPEGGSDMMRKVQSRVAEPTASVDAFVKKHAK